MEPYHQRGQGKHLKKRLETRQKTPTSRLTAQLWSLVPEDIRTQYLAGEKKDTAPVIDLLPLGYSKLLGKGRLPEIPLVVRARYVSKLAERKLKEAGAVVELVA